MPSDSSGATDSLSASFTPHPSLADGAATGDVLFQVYEANWILGPLVDPWRIGPVMPSSLSGPPPP